MRRLCGYIAIVGILLGVTVSCRRARVIPEDTLSKMYAEMLLCDQWIVEARLATQADTHFIYKPVFDKYGYTSDDYRKTVASYLAEPDRYAKVFKTAKEMLDARYAAIEDEEERIRKRDSVRTALSMKYAYLPRPALYRDVITAYTPVDTVVPGPDSLKYTINIPELDTLYSGPLIRLRQQKDSVAAEVPADSLGTMVPETAAPAPKPRPVPGLKKSREL